jgi:hypothetical protein
MKQRLAAIGVVEALPQRVATFIGREIATGDNDTGAPQPTEQQQ